MAIILRQTNSSNNSRSKYLRDHEKNLDNHFNDIFSYSQYILSFYKLFIQSTIQDFLLLPFTKSPKNQQKIICVNYYQSIKALILNDQPKNQISILAFCYNKLIFSHLMQVQNSKEPTNNFVGMHGQNIGLGFTARDNAAKTQQQKHEISFKVIKNDGVRQSLKYLLDLKNIFARQLPKMPKQYIVKLVFDRNHQSMVILKNNQKVIGGICFRQFKQQRFAEIAFLAITSTQQIRGFGTRLMNKLKEQMQRRKVQYMMTYADNLALGYFRKQGFSKDCRMPTQRWKGYIKDYQGGTMMECYVHPTIDYSRVSDIIRKQKQLVVNKIKELCINNLKFDGKQLQKKIKQNGFIRKNAQGQQQYFRINPLDIPGVKESGWTWTDHDELVKTKQVSFLLECQNIIQTMKKHNSVWPFRQPVSVEDVPDYTLIVKNPIDLKSIQKKLANNQYKDRQSFCEDILRIFENCRLYNQPQTVYYKCSVQLEDYIKPFLQTLKQGKGQINGSSQFKRPAKNLKRKTVQKKTKKI